MPRQFPPLLVLWKFEERSRAPGLAVGCDPDAMDKDAAWLPRLEELAKERGMRLMVVRTSNRHVLAAMRRSGVPCGLGEIDHAVQQLMSSHGAN